jgi:esterase/lipase
MWKSMYGDQITTEMEEKGFSHVYSQHLKRDLRINKSYYEDALNYDMDKVIEEINCPLLVVQGTADKLLSHAQNYFDRSRVTNKQLKVVKEADHNYTNPEHLRQVKTAVAEWFAKTLE